jgi:uroporphyrinogen decarboxylase
MTKREIIRLTLNGGVPPYVPWSFKFTQEPTDLIRNHYQVKDIDFPLENHILNLGSDIGFFEELPNNLFRDVFGVVWDRTVDKDIGVPIEPVLKDPSLDGYQFPDPHDPRFFANIHDQISAKPDLFRVFQIGFSLFERAWTLRGMENLLTDFFLNPGFVRELMESITRYNLAQIEKAISYDIDAVYFGDDWGQQHGLIMGYDLWKDFILPCLIQMYQRVKRSGKFVMIHSCGDVDELFPDLIDAGVSCFNPFQPEVMDVHSLLKQYHKKLCFHGGLSIQKTLPFGSTLEVMAETSRLIKQGELGGLILAPSHSVESDTPFENILAFIQVAQCQPGFLKSRKV